MLDLVAGLVDLPVEGTLDFPVALLWSAGLDVPRNQCLAELIAVATLVGDQRVCSRQLWIEQFCANVVTHLVFGQKLGKRPSIAVTDDMQLRVQATLGAPYTAGNIPFLSRLAAVRCALRWVASILMRCRDGRGVRR